MSIEIRILCFDQDDPRKCTAKRMERFERVTKLARELKISVFFEVDELVDKHIKLFD